MDDNNPTPTARFFRRMFIFGSAVAAVSYLAIVQTAAEAALWLGVMVAFAGFIGWSISSMR